MKKAYVAATAIAVLALAGLYAALPGARLIDLYSREGMVKPGQPVHLQLTVKRPWYDFHQVTITITAGLKTEPVATLSSRGGIIEWTPPGAGGYGVTARLGKQQVSTAVDVGDAWTERPRYGFMTDFAPTDKGQSDRFDSMARFHLNALQFYDWMQSHSNYVPTTAEYRDPLARLLSVGVLREKIEQAHQHGMAAMAYTAVYAAPKTFFESHPEWALYDRAGRPMGFGNGFLYIMNPEPGGPWEKYTVDQYKQIVTKLPFDGIHLDQFGDPKYGFRYSTGDDPVGVDVGSAFTPLINDTKAAIAGRPVFFNDVGAWSLRDTAMANKDAVYVEVWPPNINFDHLHKLINEGHQRSGGKPVVLAAYISPNFAPSVLLSDAVIFASGGYHLEIGEGNGMLNDPYFPKHKMMDADLAAHLRRYYDVIVRYQDLLYAKGLQDWTPDVTIADTRILPGAYFNGVWPFGRQSDRYQVLHLVNLNGLDSARWNAPNLKDPPVLEKRGVTVTMDKAPKALYLINADDPDQSPVPVPFTYRDGQVQFTLDRLAYWDLLVFEK